MQHRDGGSWPLRQHLTLGELLKDRAQTHRDAPAILAPGHSPISFGALLEFTSQLAGDLRSRGVGSQTRVAVVLPNGPAMAVAFLGAASCAACAPLNPGYRAAEFRFYLEDTGAEVVVVARGDEGPARATAYELGLKVLEVDVDPRHTAPAGGAGESVRGAAAPTNPSAGDVALVLHTSGTTARPKIVPLSHANLLASARSIAAHLALRPEDRCLNVMPLFHIHGLVGALLSSLVAGGSIVCTPGFDEARFFDWIAEFGPTWYTAVPTIHQSVVTRGDRYRQVAPDHRFRFVRSSSASLPPNVFRELESLTGAPVIEAYGMTEASHQMASNPLPPGARKAGSVGVPAGAEIAIMDASGSMLARGQTGEIVIRGPGVTTGYEGNPEANAKAFTDGWFRTGDQGRFEEDGYLYISGRLKEIVNRGGEKVSPREVDEALLEHPEVGQAVAFGVPHASLGEDLVAAVVRRPGSLVGEAALRQFLFGRLAEFKVPSQVVFVDAIPKGPTGKVQRTTLHEKLGPLLQRAYVAPVTQTERSVELIVREVLGRGPVGIDDNFFSIGGDSLKGTRVVARIAAEHGVSLSAATLFQHPTIAALARAVDALRGDGDIDAALAEEIASLSDEEVERLLKETTIGR